MCIGAYFIVIGNEAESLIHNKNHMMKDMIPFKSILCLLVPTGIHNMCNIERS